MIKAMKVVLLTDVQSLGRKFEIKNAAFGYARNYLFPNGLAAPADRATLKKVESLKRQYEANQAKKKTQADRLVDELAETMIIIKAKANEQGHLFAKIGKKEISEATGLPEEIIMLETPIREIGEHSAEAANSDKNAGVWNGTDNIS